MKIFNYTLTLALLTLWFTGCAPAITNQVEKKDVPDTYTGKGADSTSVAQLSWKNYFADTLLNALIDSALVHNQELNIMKQEINISQNEIRARKGEYLPFVGIRAGAEVDKPGGYTWEGSIEKNVEITKGPDVPASPTNLGFGLVASWELDFWKKLRNAKAAAVERYLSSIEGRHFAVSNMVAEIAASYYELVALDNQLAIIEQNIALQSDALRIVRIQKEAAKVTQLAINRFEAQLLNTQNLQYAIKQRIVETENRIRFLTASRETIVRRNTDAFSTQSPDSLAAGVPSQLLLYRPDIRQMEYELAASRLDVLSARANFYPAVRIVGGAGLSAFSPAYIFRPESLIFNLGGDLLAPLINKNAIQATYNNASAKQIQAVYKYEQTVLNAFLEVSTVLSGYQNASRSLETKTKEVDILTQSISISNNLFRFAKADYLEILLTQREALDSRMELIEIKLKQTEAKVELYRALGGGWN